MLSQAEPAQAGPEAMKRRDLPLRGQPHPHDRLHPALYAAELAGTALLVSIGLSVVIALWGRGSPLAALLPDLGPRRAVNGFLFGSVAALVALSPLGRISGAHINPAVTLAFWLEGKIAWRDAGCYVVAQFLGAALGALPLLAWGAMGRSVDFGATLPEAGVPIWWPLLGEAGCTFLLVTVIFVTAAHPPLHPFAAPSNAPLFCLLVWLEGPLSGASANPARSFGPDLVAGLWQGQWIYAAGPCLGAALAVSALRLEVIGRHRPHAARRHHIGIDARPPS
jgi:aquaporin Z